MTTRAAVYCRISSDREGEALGVDRQEHDARALALRRGWAVIEPAYVDNDVSASSGRQRPAYSRLLADIAAGRVDAVVVYRLDRLHRRPIELETFMPLCEKHGVALASVAGDVDLATPEGKLHARIMGSVAAHEAAMVAARQRRKHQETAEGGGSHGGPRAYGFEADGVTVNPHEATVIQTAARRLLDGASLRGVTLELDTVGEHGVSGKPFQAARLARILLSPRVIGLREHAGATYPAKWPALISEEDQIVLRSMLRDPARSTPGRMPKHLLSGLLRCSNCGRPMKWSGASRRNRPTYACSPPPRGCGRMSIRADTTEQTVVGWVIDRNFTGGQLADQGAPERRQPAPDPGAERARLDALADAYARGDVTLAQMTRATAAIRQRIAEAEDRLATAAQLRVTATAGATLRERWADLSTDDRRTALASIVKAITVTPAVKHPGRPTFDPTRIHVEWPEFDGDD